MFNMPYNFCFGDIITITPADPAAGANLSFLVPINAFIIPLSIDFLFTTSAVVATRIVSVSGYDGSDRFQVTKSQNSQAASAAWSYHFSVNIGGAIGLAGTSEQNGVISYPMLLRQGDSLITNIVNIDAGDQISNVVIRYLQFIAE